jgi:RNA polymerase sigma-B factor
MDTMHAHSVESLDAPIDDDDNSSMSTLGAEDQTIEQLEGWADVAPLLRTLPERERMLLYYRFVAGMPQSQIAQKLGISQMHVSRLLSRTLQALRSAVSGAERP